MRHRLAKSIGQVSPFRKDSYSRLILQYLYDLSKRNKAWILTILPWSRLFSNLLIVVISHPSTQSLRCAMHDTHAQSG